MGEQYCKQADCDARTGCIFGEPNPNDCEHREMDAESTVEDTNTESPMPWHGSALGMTELQFVATRGRPWLIGVIGPHNAGKTTFLTSVYLMLFHGVRMQEKAFAGSFTLRAWEELANNLRYPTDTEPMFPRHTPVTKDRVPGLLHLAFRNERNRIEDFLFTDAPGEWFSNWAKNRNADNAEGARWIASNADEFLFFIDSEELAGQKCGITRNSITMLAQRLSDEVKERPVRILWSKADCEIDNEIRNQVTKRLNKFFPNATHVSISVSEAQQKGIQDVAEALLARNNPQGRSLVLDCPIETADPFIAFRVE